jgi:hypothetical protein
MAGKHLTMRVDEKILKTIVFVGLGTRNGFTPYGTGFLTANTVDGHLFQAFLTAKHVIDKIPGDDVYMRVNTRDGGAQVVAGPKSDWLPHPDNSADVVVCSGILRTDQFDILHLPLEGPMLLTEELIREHDIGLGDEIFVAGMFTARIGNTKNIPIVRVGNISAMPEEEIRTDYGQHHAYLVESRSIDGLSGSPVFVRRQSVQQGRDGHLKFQHGQMEFLMGLLLGHNPVTNPADTVSILSPDQSGSGAVEVPMPWNTGIGVVLPISYVVEAINQSTMIKRRREAILVKG